MPTPTREGYTFDGWYTSKEYTTKVTSTSSMVTAGSHELYAKWTGINYILTYDGNTGTPSATSKTVTYGSAYGTLATATKNGYTLNNWLVNSSAIISSTIVATTSNHTAVASWTANTITLDWNEDGGTALTNGSCTYDQALTLPSAPTKTNYTFNGWTVNGTTYAANTSITSGCTYTNTKAYTGTSTSITAKWCNDCNKNITNGSCSLNANTAGTCTYTTSCDTGYTESNGGTYNPTCDANTIIIDYQENGGNELTNGSCTYNGDLTLATPTRSGYKFAGWKLADNTYATGTVSGGCNLTKTGVSKETSTSITATWCQECAEVTNGSCTLTASNGTCSYETSCNTGYTISGDGTRTPSCTAKTFDVSFDANGGDFTAATTLIDKLSDTTQGIEKFMYDSDWNEVTTNEVYTEYRYVGSGDHYEYEVIEGKEETCTTELKKLFDEIYPDIISETDTGTLCNGGTLYGSDISDVFSESGDFNISYEDASSYIDRTYVYGAVKNYVTFNNEMWRIIGMFEDSEGNYQLKIMKDEGVDVKTWHYTSAENVGWMTSSLKTYVTDTYYSTLSNTVTSMIDEDALFNINYIEYNDSLMIADEYIKEKTTDNSSLGFDMSNNTIKAGIINLSDYGYATIKSCRSTYSLYNYDNSICSDNNWMMDSKMLWTINNTNNGRSAWYVDGAGKATKLSNLNTRNIKPVVYLKSTVQISGGTGTSTDPYTLGAGTSPTKSVTYDSTYGNLPTASYIGHTFLGWYTSSTGGTEKTSSTKVTITATETLYAHWDVNSYAVTLNANGGTLSSATGWTSNTGGTLVKDITYATTYGELPTPIREGYTFSGWYIDLAYITQVTSTSNMVTASSHMLYAKWTANSYTLTYDANGGTVSPISKSVTYNSTYGDLATPTYSGYKFLGWYTLSSGGDKVTSSTTVTNVSNHTIYAHWEMAMTASQLITSALNDSDSGLETLRYDSEWNEVTSNPTYTEYRYTGTSPNNYVTFSGEVWRIIGMFKDTSGEYQLKIIKDASIGSKVWNSSEVNTWIGSTMQTYLAGEYYNSLTSTAQGMIDINGIFNISGAEFSVTSKALDAYKSEKTDTNNTMKVGLMTLSDYGYAASSSCRSSIALYYYNNSTCTSNNWMQKELVEWSMTRSSSNTVYAWIIGTPGNAYAGSVSNDRGVRPVVYLKSSVLITGGEGTEEKPYTLNYIPDPVSFSTDSWETIINAVQNDNISAYSVGDTKTVDMGDLGTHTLRIANTSTPSECSNSGYSQTACGFVLEFADIVTQRYVNTSSTNVGGWPATDARTYANYTIYNALPEELKNAIIDTTVISGHGSTSGEENFTTIDKLYLLSTMEVWGTAENDTLTETRQLDYYKNNAVTLSSYSSVAKAYSSSAYPWCTRSSVSNSNSTFNYALANGELLAGTANGGSGISPAFRIG